MIHIVAMITPTNILSNDSKNAICQEKQALLALDQQQKSTSLSDTPDSLVTVMSKRQQQQQYSGESLRPLPSVVTDYIALTLCDLLPTRKQNATLQKMIPGLLCFIQRITTEACVSCHAAVVVLIYLERCKASLPRNALGDEDTAHRIFVAALLISCKLLKGTTWCRYDMTNSKMAQICAIYNLSQVNQLECSFLNLIKHRCWVDDTDVQSYLVAHRQDLLL